MNAQPVTARRIHSIEPIPPRDLPPVRRYRRALGRPRRPLVSDDAAMLPVAPRTVR